MKKILLGLSLIVSVIYTSISSADMSVREQLIQERIKPVGDVYISGESAAPKPKAAKADFSPDAYYNKYCSLCHKAGVAGAPVFGNKEQWAPRISTGLDKLVYNAVNGIRSMPAKGTCMECSEAQIKEIVQYMVEKSQ